jgi:broad specificity phosphatase PhoE
MHIFIIRHLPTSYNQRGLLQGRRDISISETISNSTQGDIENNKLTIKKKVTNIKHIFTSALLRTQQTAELYGYDNYQTEILLNALDFGQYVGMPKQKMLAELGSDWVDNPASLVLGESLMSFEARIKQFLESYKGLDNMLIFGHGSWIRGLYSVVNSGDISNMNKVTVNNNQLFEFEI